MYSMRLVSGLLSVYRACRNNGGQAYLCTFACVQIYVYISMLTYSLSLSLSPCFVCGHLFVHL